MRRKRENNQYRVKRAVTRESRRLTGRKADAFGLGLKTKAGALMFNFAADA